MTTEHKIHVIIVAAGTGQRFSGSQSEPANTLPKQYQKLGQSTLLGHSIAAFDHVKVNDITVVLHPDDQHWTAQQPMPSKHRLTTTHGGSQRHDSERNGLKAIKPDAQDWVLVHDAARPCVTANEIKDLITACVAEQQGGLLVTPLTDTIKYSTDGSRVMKTVDRKPLYAALTPQMFRCGDLLKALTVFEADSITDEASAMEAQGHKPIMVMGQATNIKVTRHDDLALAAVILQQQERL